MITLNGNVLCAIDVETTGLNPGFHEITQVCFLPLDNNLKPRKDIVPFDLWLKIDHEERIDWSALKLSKINFFKHQQQAIDKYRAADLFEDWVEKLKLPINKRISPLAHNWPFDRAFIWDWLQPTGFGTYIDGRFRDSMSLAISINDIYERMAEPVPFPKVNLSYLCSMLKIPHEGAHTAINDCVVTAEAYKELIKTKGYLDGTS
ncbi:MAG: 3'-5' exonuclease [Euryarchaeota archaeon]|nr:3'-5' exonuclease [Euryarchaeota archaeon]